MTPDMQALVQRLEEVEKQVAHLAALVTKQSDTDRTVEAQSFIVRDEQGQRRAEFGLTIPVGLGDAHPWLGLFDADENVRACIGVGGDGPWFELYNQKGGVGIEIHFHDDNPALKLFGENGEPTVSLITTEFGPSVTVINPNGPNVKQSELEN